MTADGPRILVTLSMAWWHRVGLSTLTFGRMIRRSGGVAVRLPFRPNDDAGRRQSRAAELMERCDGVILGGGRDVDPHRYGAPGETTEIDRQRDAFEVWLLERARQRGLAMLGVCRGCQLLNVVEGGTLRDLRRDEALRRMHGRGSHEVDVVPGTLLHDAVDAETLRVRSLHGQAVDRVAPTLRVSASASDGVIEAVEFDDDETTDAGIPSRPWAVGVQWHPELTMRRRVEHRLIDALVAAARRDLM